MDWERRAALVSGALAYWHGLGEGGGRCSFELENSSVPSVGTGLHVAISWTIRRRRASTARSFHAFSPLLVGMSYGSDLG